MPFWTKRIAESFESLVAISLTACEALVDFVATIKCLMGEELLEHDESSTTIPLCRSTLPSLSMSSRMPSAFSNALTSDGRCVKSVTDVDD